jgi:hypothetical protein
VSRQWGHWTTEAAHGEFESGHLSFKLHTEEGFGVTQERVSLGPVLVNGKLINVSKVLLIQEVRRIH